MSLNRLFNDRKIRKQIYESVMNAGEIGKGECEGCHKERSLLYAFDSNLCEDCANKLIKESRNYDIEFTKMPTRTEILDKIDENRLIVGKAQQLMDDLKNIYHDDLKELGSKYNLRFSNSTKQMLPDKGRVNIADANFTSGKTKINQFIIDYDCSFTTEKLAVQLVPDADGTSAPLKVKGKVIASSPNSSAQASTTTVPKSGSPMATTRPATTTQNQSSSKITKQVNPANMIQTTSGTAFNISLGDIKISVELDKVLGSGQRIVKLDIVGKQSSHTIDTDSDDPKKVAKAVLDKLKEVPMLLPGIDEDDARNGIVINKYPAYSFKFDENSFDKGKLSVGMYLGDKPMKKTRVEITKKELNSRVQLEAKIRKAMDDVLKRYYPCLFDGTLDMKLSIGKTHSELVEVVSNPQGGSGVDAAMVKVHTEVGSRSFFDWSASGGHFQDKEICRNTLYDLIYSNIHKIIPGWNDKQIRTAKTSPNGMLADSFHVDVKTPTGSFTAYADFRLDDLYDTGNIILRMSVIDDNSGEEEPKTAEKILYKKAGTNLADFIKAEGQKLYNKYFRTAPSSQLASLTYSAQMKLKSPAKKQALFRKIADKLHKLFLQKDRKNFDDLEVEIERFIIDKNGYPTEVVIRVSDPDYLVADDARSLASKINLDTKFRFLKFLKADASPRGIDEYGASVLYSVDGMDEFSDEIGLRVMESMILEAFDLQPKTRKTIAIKG